MAPATECFRFLDLPAELRLIVYDNLATQHTVTLDVDEPWLKSFWSFRGPLTARAFTFPVTLLETCKLIKLEAEPIFHRLAQYESVEVLQSSPYKSSAYRPDIRMSHFLFPTLSYLDMVVTLTKEVRWTNNEKQDLDKCPYIPV
jgi:hypothetical protein